MRSRNGNRPIVYAICALTAAISLKADDYLIGYRLTTLNAQSIQESLDISKAMMPCPLERAAPLTLNRNPDESIDALLNRERTLFVEYAAVQAMRLKSNETINDTHVKSSQTLTLPTKCYAVEFNDRLVTISLLH